MKEVNVICDRCEKEIEGLESREATSGFYRVDGGYWSQFADDDEKIVCDRCMHNDRKYREIYNR